MEWNPDKPGILGLEWPALVGGYTTLDSNGKLIATSFDQSVAQAISDIRIANVGIPQRGGIYAVEVYDNETAVGDTVVVANEPVPNEDVSIGSWHTNTGATTSLWNTINEQSATVDSTDYIIMGGAQSEYTGRFNTAGQFTGRRILALRLNINAAVGPTGSMLSGLNLNGTNYYAGGYLYGPRDQNWSNYTWTYNPFTRKPWTIADVQALDSTDEFFIYGATQAGVWAGVVIYDVTLTVFSVAENRLAVGILDDTGSALAAGTYSNPLVNACSILQTPTGGAWTKDGSGRHLYTLRRLTNNGSMVVPYFQANGANAPVGRSWDTIINPTFGHTTQMVAALWRLYPFMPRLTGPVNSVDAIPWVKQTVGLVYTGRTAEQEIDSATATNPYGVLRFAVSNASHPTATLDVKIKRRSDNVQFGGTYSLTDAVAATFPPVATGSSWRIVQVQLPSNAALAAATQYFIEFSSSAPSTTPWNVMALDANGFHPEGTYAQATDAATINGARNTSADLIATLSTVPAAPASMTAALGSQATTETVACITTIPRADLSWVATALGGVFVRYDMQRSEDGGATWVDIADVLVESVVAWKDYEAPRGVACLYRIRSVRNDGAVSNWTQAAASVTKPLLAGGTSPTLYLVSNYTPALNLAFEYAPVKNYVFNEAAEQQLQGVYGRDYQLGANPTENRGVTASWTLLVGLDDKVAQGVGFDAFTPLRNLARAAIPYVCALDHRGKRLMVQLRVPKGDEDSTGAADRYLAEVSASQLTATPFVVQVSS